MGYGQFSSDYHKPFSKRELMATAGNAESETGNISESKLMAKNTLRYVAKDENGKRVGFIYHKTRILFLDYDESGALVCVFINTGGFNTLTTRERLNRFLPSGWSVFTDKGFLYVRTPSGTFPHVDGATYDGATGKPKQPERHKDSRAVAIAHKRKIDKFCRAIDREGIPMPCAGDPWIFDWNPRAIGESVLLEWLDSEYVNGALIVHAMRRKGWQDGALHMVFTRPDDWRPQVKRAVRDFFKAGLGIG
jgi:hypothetical protein